MKAITCELCGSSELIKQDGLFVCQNCGAKYSPEEARRLIDVDVETARSEDLENLCELARRSREMEDYGDAAKYYSQIALRKPWDWDAAFYQVYCKAKDCKVADIVSTSEAISNCLDPVLGLIVHHVNVDKRENAALEVYDRTMEIGEMLYQASLSHYKRTSYSVRKDDIPELIERAESAMRVALTLGDSIARHFHDETMMGKAEEAWKEGIAKCLEVSAFIDDESKLYRDATQHMNSRVVEVYVPKVKEIDPAYRPGSDGRIPPSEEEPDEDNKENKKSGCYIATCVYGSYDCSQVWTLRRYRDTVLSSSWFGQCFIKVYYAISPTLVRLFGRYKWVKGLWKAVLDPMVKNLNHSGISDEPYDGC